MKCEPILYMKFPAQLVYKIIPALGMQQALGQALAALQVLADTAIARTLVLP
jgi:hypothetical protein